MNRALQQGNGHPFERSPVSALGDLSSAEDSCVRNDAISIVIADGHAIFREGLRMLLHSRPGFCVVGEAGDGEEVIRMVRERKPDVLLLDLAMPRSTGLDALRELAKMSTSVRTIVLAAAVEASEMEEAIRLGARAVMLKESASDALFDCIRAVMAGRYWIGNELVSDLVQALRRLFSHRGAERRLSTFGLTQRELEVIEAIVAGYTNKDMAQKFSVSEHTVKHHLTNIFDKLGVSNRLELVLFAAAHQLRTPNSSLRDP
jgi:DNA-binding NarL/FixJ family response regulator